MKLSMAIPEKTCYAAAGVFGKKITGETSLALGKGVS